MAAVNAVPGLSLVKSMSSAHLTEADTYWSHTAERLEQSFATVSAGLAQPGGSAWHGVAAASAQERGNADLLTIRTVANQLHDAADIARLGATRLDASRQQVLDAVAAAEQDDFEVSDNYSVTDLWSGGSEEFQANRKKLAQQHADDMWHKASALAAADREIAGKIAGATEGIQAFSFDGAPESPAPELPPEEQPKDRLQEILEQYQVSEDPEGLKDWEPPWPLSLATDPTSVTAGEGKILDQLNPIGMYNMNEIKQDATEEAKRRFPPPPGPEGSNQEIDNQTDAFRHAYWNALMTQKFGEDWTRNFATAHERRPDNYATSEAMDLYNNEIGRGIAVNNPNASPKELADLVQRAVSNGQMVVINGDGTKLLWSNQQAGAPGISANSAPVPGTTPNLPPARPDFPYGRVG